MIFAPVLPVVLGLAYFIRVDGGPVLSSSALVLSSLGNVGLDYLFVARWGWGIGGAAFATGGAQMIGLAMLSAHFLRRGRNLRLTREKGYWRELARAVCNGSSEFINETSGGIMILMFNWAIVTSSGTEVIAAFSVVSYILLLGMMVAYGFSDPMAPLVSANMAAGKVGRSKRFLGITMGTVFGNGLVFFLFLALSSKFLAGVFLPDDAKAQAFAVRFLRIFKYAFLFSGINIVWASYFTGLHRSIASLTVAMLRGMVLPAALLLMLPGWLGETGLFLVLPLAEAATLLAALFIAAALRKQGAPCPAESEIAGRGYA